MRALIIEDHPCISEVLRDMFVDAGWLTTIVDTLADARRAMESDEVYGVITWDFEVKDGDTLKLLEEFRPKLPHTVMIAASNNYEHRDAQLKAGCTHDMGRYGFERTIQFAISNYGQTR